MGSSTCWERLAAWVATVWCRISHKKVIMVFHDYSTVITRVKYALFWPHFSFFSRYNILVRAVPVLVLFTIISFCF